MLNDSKRCSVNHILVFGNVIFMMFVKICSFNAFKKINYFNHISNFFFYYYYKCTTLDELCVKFSYIFDVYIIVDLGP